MTSAGDARQGRDREVAEAEIGVGEEIVEVDLRKEKAEVDDRTRRRGG